MKGIKVIEESRFLSKDIMEMVKGGLMCNTDNIYSTCGQTNNSYAICGDYSYEPCRTMHGICFSYANSDNQLCSVDSVYNFFKEEEGTLKPYV